MSEQRRATLTPFGKSDKKSKKFPRKTFRFSFVLSDPNEDSCPVFDYGSVVKSEERKIFKIRCEEKEKKSNGVLDPFSNDEDVKRLAQMYEEKYSGKKGKCKSYAELGAGYDETDPFIDNTEAYDEALQEDQETPCGGYYINSGPLELKRVELSDQSDADEVGKRRHKRVLSVIAEEDEVKSEVEEAVDGTDKSCEESPTETTKAKVTEQAEENTTPTANNTDEPVRKKKKMLFADDVDSRGVVKLKKAKTVKTLLEEKRVRDTSPLVSDEPKKQLASITSISEAIESVVNAVNIDENSNSSYNSQSGTASTSMSEDSQEGKSCSQNTPPTLPENLPAELLTLVDQIRRAATVAEITRKTFSSDINNALVKLEWKTRELSATNRKLLFAHLAFYLPCTKDTLMRRAKKLFIQKEESQIDTVICKLKATIDAAMPSLLEKYGKECQRIASEKDITNSNQQMDNLLTPESAAAKLPKRKFLWTEETRGYLKEIVRLKNRCFKVLKPRKNTNEDYVTTFLHTKIRTLWPAGWMRTSVLQRESSRSPVSGKLKYSSSHSPNKSDTTRLIDTLSYPSANPSNGTPHPLYVSPNASGEVSHQPLRSPHSAKSADSLNILTKITSSLSTSPSPPKKSYSPKHHQTSKTEKPESFSVDCLLKRINENNSFNEYNTTLDLKQDSVIMNGASLPLKHVNNSEVTDSGRSENILDLSSSVSVIHSVERTTSRVSDSNKQHINSSMPSRKENVAVENKKAADVERRMSDETTTATDILSQIISESLMAPSQPPIYNKVEEVKAETPHNKGHSLLYDVMKDLKELNDLSSGGSLDTKHDIKKNSYTGTSWSRPTKPSDPVSKTSQYQNEFLKHLRNTEDNPLPSAATPPYSRHSASPYENSPYINDINKSVYNSSPHLSAQSMSSLTGSPASKVSQGCIMKTLPNTGISSGNPHRYLNQMDYGTDDQHLLGLASSLQYGLAGWPYSGSESQPQQ